MTVYRTPDNSKVYKQYDAKWAYDPYPTKNYSFANNGCGCCAVTHCIIEREKYKNYTPATVRPYMVQYAVKGKGTMWDGITKALKYYGLKNVQALDSMSLFFNELKKGDRVGVILVTNTKGPDGSVWTMGGHYIAVVGYKEQNGKHYFYIKDSGGRHTKGWYCYEKSLKGCLRKLWVGQLPDEIELPAKGYWTLNDKSPEICKIQAFLKDKGYYNGYVAKKSGKIAEKTFEAIKKWQKASGLVVDGKWGPKCNAEYEAQK